MIKSYQMMMGGKEAPKNIEWQTYWFYDDETGEFYFPMPHREMELVMAVGYDDIKIISATKKGSEHPYFPFSWLIEEFKDDEMVIRFAKRLPDFRKVIENQNVCN